MVRTLFLRLTAEKGTSIYRIPTGKQYCGSVTLWYGSRLGSFFCQWMTDVNNKWVFFKVFLLNFFKVHLHDFISLQKSKRSHKIVEIKIFLLILLVDWKIQIYTNNDESRWPKQCRQGCKFLKCFRFPCANPFKPETAFSNIRIQIQGFLWSKYPIGSESEPIYFPDLQQWFRIRTNVNQHHFGRKIRIHIRLKTRSGSASKLRAGSKSESAQCDGHCNIAYKTKISSPCSDNINCFTKKY